MTGTGEIPGVPQSAAAGPTLTAASEHTERVENALPTHLQQTLLKAAETGDLHLVQELLRQGADPNAEEFSNSRRRVLRESSDSSKKPRRAEDVRRSARIGNTKPINYNLTEYTLVESFQMDEEIRDYYIPKDYEDAISCPDAPHWIAAMEEELEGLGDADCFIRAKLPPGAKAIPCKRIFSVKTDSLGRLIRYKARLVAGVIAKETGLIL